MKRKLLALCAVLAMSSQFSYAETENIIRSFAPIAPVEKQQAEYDFTFISTELANGMAGQGYSFDMNSLVEWTGLDRIKGEIPSLSWSAKGLPTGLNISTAGLITGTPASASKNTFTAYATSPKNAHSAEFDMTVAAPAVTSCKTLQEANPTAPSGVYMLTLGGRELPAYCDMVNNGGGWTLVGRAAPKKPGLWSYSRDDVALVANPSPSATESFKYSDETINAISKSVFRVVSSGYTNTRFFNGACVYNQLEVPTGDCSISFGTPDLSGASRGNGSAGGGGLSDSRSSIAKDGFYVTTSWPNNAAGWGAGSGGTVTYTGSGIAGTIIGLTLWVR